MSDSIPSSGYHLPPLPWLRAFEAAARHSSFTAAAEELNLTQAAVSHQVRSLEKHLGVTLFERLPRSLRLTEMGAAYLPPLRTLTVLVGPVRPLGAAPDEMRTSAA